MFDLETAHLEPAQMSPQNRRAACYLHYDLATIAGHLSYLSCLLKALSCSDMDEYYLREVPGALSFAAVGVDEIFWALDEISGKIARPHGLSTILKAPEWWQQVEDRKGGGSH